MKKYKDEIIGIFILIIIILFVYGSNNYTKNLRKNGRYTSCKIVDFKGYKNGPGLIFELYINNDTFVYNGLQYGDMLKYSEMKNKYFVVRFDPLDPNKNNVLLRYELNESIARQIDSGVSTLGQILILPGVKFHEEIVNFDDGL